MASKNITITLPREELSIVLKVLEFDAMNVDFEDPAYDTALWTIITTIKEGMKA